MQKEENLELYQWPLHSSFTNFSFCTTNFCAAKEKKNVALVHSIKDRITKSFCCNMTSTHAGRTLIKNPQRAEILNSIEKGLRKLAEEGVCAWRTIGTAHKPNHGFSENRQIACHGPGKFTSGPGPRLHRSWPSSTSLNMPSFSCLGVIAHAILSTWIALFLLLELINSFSTFTSQPQCHVPREASSWQSPPLPHQLNLNYVTKQIRCTLKKQTSEVAS